MAKIKKHKLNIQMIDLRQLNRTPSDAFSTPKSFTQKIHHSGNENTDEFDIDWDWDFIAKVADEALRSEEWIGKNVSPSYPNADGWSMDGIPSRLDGLAIASCMQLWIKQVCCSGGVDAPTMSLFGVDESSGLCILEQHGHDAVMESEQWWDRDAYQKRGKCEKGEALNCGPGTDYRNLPKTRVTRKLCDKVLQLREPALEPEMAALTYKTTRVESMIALPVIRVGGTLEGIVVLGIRHRINEEPAVSNFISSVALSLRNTYSV